MEEDAERPGGQVMLSRFSFRSSPPGPLCFLPIAVELAAEELQELLPGNVAVAASGLGTSVVLQRPRDVVDAIVSTAVAIAESVPSRREPALLRILIREEPETAAVVVSLRLLGPDRANVTAESAERLRVLLAGPSACLIDAGRVGGRIVCERPELCLSLVLPVVGR